jgi:hypothetical protein
LFCWPFTSVPYFPVSDRKISPAAVKFMPHPQHQPLEQTIQWPSLPFFFLVKTFFDHKSGALLFNSASISSENHLFFKIDLWHEELRLFVPEELVPGQWLHVIFSLRAFWEEVLLNRRLPGYHSCLTEAT